MLIVDDEPESLHLIHRTLRRRYAPLTASTGPEGLRRLEASAPAVIIADQRMPGMTGVEFLAEAARRRPLAQRILLTAYTEVEGLIEAINAGHVFGYLPKPWHPEALLAMVRRAEETHRLLRDRETLLRDLQEKNAVLGSLLEETRRLQETRIEAERWAAVGKLAGMVAHDLRNPLTAIQCRAGMLQERGEDEEERGRAVEAILRQVRAMRRYVDELLLFAGRGPGDRPRPRPYSLPALVASVQEIFASRCAARGIRLHARLAYRGKVRVVPSHAYRVLENLVQNALDAVDQGGEILVASERISRDEVVLRVADSGTGIADEIRGRLFEPLSTYGKPGGTGLGLAIVKRLLSEFGGRVWEEPWGLGGACFHVVLPTAAGGGMDGEERGHGSGTDGTAR